MGPLIPLFWTSGDVCNLSSLPYIYIIVSKITFKRHVLKQNDQNGEILFTCNRDPIHSLSISVSGYISAMKSNINMRNLSKSYVNCKSRFKIKQNVNVFRAKATPK